MDADELAMVVIGKEAWEKACGRLEVAWQSLYHNGSLTDWPDLETSGQWKEWEQFVADTAEAEVGHVESMLTDEEHMGGPVPWGRVDIFQYGRGGASFVPWFDGKCPSTPRGEPDFRADIEDLIEAYSFLTHKEDMEIESGEHDDPNTSVFACDYGIWLDQAELVNKLALAIEMINKACEFVVGSLVADFNQYRQDQEDEAA
jgi:hypothetical protein